MVQPRLILPWTILLVLTLCPLDRQVAHATCRSIAGLGPQSAYGVADTQGRIIDGCHLDQPLVPASILKIATISSALQILGPEYRFRSEFFLDPEQNLWIKGYGDPGLVSEEIATIAVELQRKGLRRVGLIYIDDSAFALEHQVPGQAETDNPYDAPVGPLSVNFNALPFVKQGNTISSGESQTPNLPLMTALGRSYPPGRYRINICTGSCDAGEQMARYGGELVAALLRQQGITVDGYGGRRLPTDQARLFHRHFSRQSVLEISRSTLLYSSNFMANLLYLACGAELYGYPATWAKAQKAVRQQLLLQMGEDAALITQVEGAGLARENRVTAKAMLHLLQVFQPQMGLLKQAQGVAVKTGTLTGVYNFAGYLPGGQAFVILLNQPTNTRAAVLEQLKKQFSTE
ncbi:MAG: D-alanyl-D-alanine carboxypeptidase [Desulfobulbus sp.]|nr:D-alanyl-D-alanine carboxypeptidase [Desulfobulbus sp.]